MLKEILCVGAGSFIGGALRYAVAVAMRNAGKGFPWATFTVNVAAVLPLGCCGVRFRDTATRSMSIFF